jgi:hypothetical protein
VPLHRPVSFDKVLMIHQAALQRLELGLVHVRCDVRIDADKDRPSRWAVIGASLASISWWVPKQRLLQRVVPTPLHRAQVGAQLSRVAAKEFVDGSSNRHWEVAKSSFALAEVTRVFRDSIGPALYSPASLGQQAQRPSQTHFALIFPSSFQSRDSGGEDVQRGSPHFFERAIADRLASSSELVSIQHVQVCQVQLQLQPVAAQALFDHTNWAKNTFLGDESLLALQFRGPGAAPTAIRTWTWLIEVRDWHTCFDLLSQARCEQRRNEDPSSTAHAKQYDIFNPPTNCKHFVKAP